MMPQPYGTGESKSLDLKQVSFLLQEAQLNLLTGKIVCILVAA